VVKAGGAWTSVTPGSQQYWLQAFNNVLLGRWEKMNDGYGKAVLGYFGRPPLPPDPEVIKIASEQLGKPPFDGDPLEAAPDSLSAARAALVERKLPTTDENVFLVASAIVSGKNMDLNEGIRFLTGKAKIVLPLKKKAEPAAPKLSVPAAGGGFSFTGPVTTSCTVVENGASRRFTVTIEPPGGSGQGAVTPTKATAGSNGTPVFSPFQGKTELVEINVTTGDRVSAGQVVAAVEAMKAKHDVKAPCAGTVASIDAEIGADIEAGRSILTISG